MLGHAETLLAAMRHLITKEGCAAYFLHTGAAVKRREAGWDAICENRMLQCGAEMRKTSPSLIKISLPASWTAIRRCTSI